MIETENKKATSRANFHTDSNDAWNIMLMFSPSGCILESNKVKYDSREDGAHLYEVKGPQFFVVIKPWFGNQWMRPKLHKVGSGIILTDTVTNTGHDSACGGDTWLLVFFVFRVEWKSSRRAVLSRPTSVFTSTWCGSRDQSGVSSTGNVHSSISCFPVSAAAVFRCSLEVQI